MTHKFSLGSMFGLLVAAAIAHVPAAAQSFAYTANRSYPSVNVFQGDVLQPRFGGFDRL